MAQRNIWQDEYAIRLYYDATPPISLPDAGVSANTSDGWNSATADADAFAAGAIGIDTSIYGVPLIGHPTFDAGMNVIDQRKAIGVSYRRGDTGFEYQQGLYMPTTTWEMHASKKNLAVLLWLLFQQGCTEAGTTPFLKTYVPYAETTADVEVAAALLRRMSSGTADSQLMGGAIVRSLTITGESGMPITLSAELMGYNMVTDFDFDAAANIIEYDSTAPLMFQNCTIKLATTTINIDSFNMTISNNAVPKNYNLQHINKFILNDFTVEGQFNLPWAAATVGGNAQLDNFIAGTPALLQIYWGTETPAADGDVKLEVACRYTNATNTGDNEVVTELPFAGVYDGTNNAIRCYVADAVQRKV